MNEMSSDNLFDQGASSSRNPRNNMDYDLYEADDCFNVTQTLLLHQDTFIKATFIVRQNSYEITTKEEHERMMVHF